MPRVIVCRFVDFHAAAERRLVPRYAAYPLIIGGARDSSGRVVAVSLDARARGVHVGMSLRDAAKQVPDAVFLPGRLDRALDLACEIDEALRRVATHLAWGTIDEVTIEHEASGADALVDEILAVCAPFGLSVAVGVAASQISARAAARLVGVRGVLHVLPGYEQRFLRRIDIAWLDGISPSVVSLLRSRRIETFGDLADVPVPELVRAIGREGAVLTRLAAGDDGRRVTGQNRPRRLCRTVSADAITVQQAGVDVAIDAQCESMMKRARQFGCGVRSVSLRVEFDDTLVEQRTVSLQKVVDDAGPVIVAARALAARLQLDRRPWRTATVSVTGFSELAQQLSLFDTATPARHAARLRTRAGFAALAAVPYVQRRHA